MTPGERIRSEMESRGWTQRDLAKVLGRPLPAINEVIQGKRAVTPEMAVALEGAFSVSAAEWLQMESVFRLAQVDNDPTVVSRRARLYEIAPVKDMEKRGWIKSTDTADELQSELIRFFGVNSLDEPLQVVASFKRTAQNNPINASQRAWSYRAKQLAKAVVAAPFDERAFEKGIKKLRKLTGWAEETRKVSRILADIGIRFVVVEPLPRSKIDGAAFWLDEMSPVIAMSMRFDRIDNFWHVLGHEISHIRHRDEPVIDSDLDDESAPAMQDRRPVENRANEEACAMWIDPAEMESFVLRVSPLYSKAKINQFANRLVVHPGIIVGQLHGRREIGFQALRDSLVRVRETVTGEAITDGWGHVLGL